MKVLLFDSGPLINFSMNGLIYIIESLKNSFNGKFIITQEVKKEVYEHPVTIKQFELGALRIQDLIDRKILEMPEAIDFPSAMITEQTKLLTDKANHFMQSGGQWIKLVSDAEMSCIAIALELKKRNIDCMLAIDERTARMLSEKPENLQRLMSKKLHKPIKLSSDFKELRELKFIRSSELIYAAHKKGLVKLKGPKALEALLYATKFKGSSISWDELNILKKL